MKVLYLMGCAGIHAFLAHLMKREGYDTKCIHNKKYDPFQQSEYYGAKMTKSKIGFVLSSLITTWFWKPDVIHLDVHKSWFIKLLLFMHESKIVLHYHGSDVRHVDFDTRIKSECQADMILVATPDLLEYEYMYTPEYLPNPIDIKLFHEDGRHRPNTGVCFMTKFQNRKETLERLKRFGYGHVNWHILRSARTPYEEMPAFLADYEYFADVKKDKDGHWFTIRATAAMQAITSGCKVINAFGEIQEELSYEHKPHHVVKQLDKIYDRMFADWS